MVWKLFRVKKQIQNRVDQSKTVDISRTFEFWREPLKFTSEKGGNLEGRLIASATNVVGTSQEDKAVQIDKLARLMYNVFCYMAKYDVPLKEFEQKVFEYTAEKCSGG